MDIRFDWTPDEVYQWMTAPLETLLNQARRLHALYAAHDVQKCQLLSIKTGACPEDCGYCSQSAHFKTEVKSEPLMDLDKVKLAIIEAKKKGATRFCMGAAWRDIPSDQRFSQILKMISTVANEGLEVCTTLGMATEEQLKKMKEAGLTAYNHNLDTSRDYYPHIISTRTYDDRLDTLKSARRAKVQLCCGGILGMGESTQDRAAMLSELARFNPHPESVPVNLLVPIKGTPLEKASSIPFEDFLRTIATARIAMPRARVRLSAGRNTLTREQQIICFESGANSIFIGERLLTAPNVAWEEDQRLSVRV